MKEIKKLTVKFNGRIVGRLVEIEEGKIAFQYDEDWIKTGFSISPFSLPLENKVFINQKTNFDNLFGVFWDSLPDGWGVILMQRKLKEKGVTFDDLSPLTKLSLVSKNGLGGLEYEPNEAYENTTYNADLDELMEECSNILNNVNEGVDLDRLCVLGGSSGGARPKVHLNINGEEWIIKFPCLIDPKNVGECEFRANSTAKKCGINVNQFALFPSKLCSGYFGAKRFDRKNGIKIHTISLSALLETSHRLSNLDYNHLFQVVERICADKMDMYEAFRRMTFNVLYKNKDDHGKNFAFVYDENLKGYKLSPAYDLTATPNNYEHEMTINGNGNPSKMDLLDLARNFKLSNDLCEQIIEETEKIIKENDN